MVCLFIQSLFYLQCMEPACQWTTGNKESREGWYVVRGEFKNEIHTSGLKIGLYVYAKIKEQIVIKWLNENERNRDKLENNLK